MQLKTLTRISCKKQLKDLYINQFSESFIRAEINEIISECRASTSNYEQRISMKEALIFISRHGEPIGFELSNEMKIKIKEV